MRGASESHDLEAQVKALRRELAALIVTLCNAGQRLEDLADELRSRRQTDNVVTSTGDGTARAAKIRTSWSASLNRAGVRHYSPLAPRLGLIGLGDREPK
jgi:hypothetical protein